MTSVWVLTLLLAGGIHHYSDTAIFASKEECETVIAVMKASNPFDQNTQHNTVCREVRVIK